MDELTETIEAAEERQTAANAPAPAATTIGFGAPKKTANANTVVTMLQPKRKRPPNEAAATAAADSAAPDSNKRAG